VGTGTDVSTLTEPEMLGPCEPGTAVNLEGIVWHETDTGELLSRVSDPDPDWIRIQSGQWIRILIRNPDPDPGGQK
jgi:hypothetical protein